ncbi:MAG: sugar ABC transporter permease, partial [Chthoniobacterales bacterium]|nr:sugar ABC transporter permease [Chthoniobacterales bacterium]
MNFRTRLFITFLLAPALLVILAVVLFPFVFNVILSFSNANLYHIRDWRLIGFAQYVSVFKQDLFWSILLKTVVWT